MISVKDANGNVITDAKHIGNLNPFRYKGYYYDADTDLYYLQSRYYNPEWGRYINADYTTLDSGAGLIGHNMYIYGANNPINNTDLTGKSILISVIFGVVGVITLITTTTQAIINNKQVNNAQNMLINGLTGSKPSNNTLNSIATKAQNSPQVETEVKKAITINNGKDFNNYVSKEVAFNSGDLGLAIGKVTRTTISGIKNPDNSWNISVTLSDRYNFEEWRKMNSFGSIANNVGYLMEKSGNLTPYDWDVSFSFTYNEE